jgi:hypothetical protein
MIDAYASTPWYVDHLAPIMAALGPEAGELHVGRRFRPRPRPPADVALVASYGDLTIVRHLGYQRFALTQHGAGQSYGGDPRRGDYPSYPGGRNHASVGLFLVPNEHAAGRWRKAYPRACVRVVGCPKLDTLPTRVPSAGPVVAVSFHWDYRLMPETRSAFPEYAAAVATLAKSYTVLGHAHPRRTDLRRFYTRIGVEQVRDFADVCRQADLYVCDNSSTLFEFAATGRPVVVLNSREYRRDVEHGLRFWDAASVGVQVDRGAGLADAVARALEQHPEDVEARERALGIVYQPRVGSAESAATALREWVA